MATRFSTLIGEVIPCLRDWTDQSKLSLACSEVLPKKDLKNEGTQMLVLMSLFVCLLIRYV
jgi:hypothetical protein